MMASNSHAGSDSAGTEHGQSWHWGGISGPAGMVVGFGVFGQTVLFLADASGLLGEGPTYMETSAGQARDLADYYVAYFEHRHTILWDIAVRDTPGPIAFLALMVLAVALMNVSRPFLSTATSSYWRWAWDVARYEVAASGAVLR